MPGGPNERKNRLAAGLAGLHGDDRAARGPAGDRERTLIDQDVAGGQVARLSQSGNLARDQFQICRRVNSKNFLVAGVARVEGLVYDAACA
jgi:hypothetical protein